GFDNLLFMQSLKLKSYEVPENCSIEAKAVIEQMRGDMDKMQELHRQQIAWLKQKFKIAMSKARPEFITEETLRDLFDESEMTVDPDVSAEVEDKPKGDREKKPRSKKQQAMPDHLPRTIVEHELSDEEKAGLSPMGFDSKLELKYTRAKFEVIEHRYLKYAGKEGIVRRPPEPSLIPQSYASPELLATIAVSKFCDHLPLYRQEQI